MFIYGDDKTNQLKVVDGEYQEAVPTCMLVHYIGRLASPPDIRAFSPLPLVTTHNFPRSQKF